MNDNDVIYKVWLIGVNDPLEFTLPADEAADVQRDVVQRLESEQPSGSLTMGNGTLIRYAAIAAAQIIPARDRAVRVLT